MTALVAQSPSQPPAAKPERTKPAIVTGKVRAAIEAMVWLALPRREAAEHAGITEHGLYKALRKPAVKAFYASELEVLRTSERARNIHRLTEIRDAANNMPAVNAIKMLEQISDMDGPSGSQMRSPGVVVIVQAAPVNGQLTGSADKPLIEHEDL